MERSNEKAPAAGTGESNVRPAIGALKDKVSTLTALRQVIIARLERFYIERAGSQDPDRVRELSRKISTYKGRVQYVDRLIAMGTPDVCPSCNGTGTVLVHDPGDPELRIPPFTYPEYCGCLTYDRAVEWCQEEFQMEGVA